MSKFVTTWKQKMLAHLKMFTHFQQICKYTKCRTFIKFGSMSAKYMLPLADRRLDSSLELLQAFWKPRRFQQLDCSAQISDISRSSLKYQTKLFTYKQQPCNTQAPISISPEYPCILVRRLKRHPWWWTGMVVGNPMFIEQVLKYLNSCTQNCPPMQHNAETMYYWTALYPVVGWACAWAVLRGRVGDGLGRGADLGIRPWDCFPWWVDL